MRCLAGRVRMRRDALVLIAGAAGHVGGERAAGRGLQSSGLGLKEESAP